MSVILEMTGDPVAVAEGDALDAGAVLSAGEEAQVQHDLEAAQGAVVPEIERLGGRVSRRRNPRPGANDEPTWATSPLPDSMW